MAKPRTRVVAAAVAVLTLVSAIGCGSDDEAPTYEVTSTPQAAVDLVPPSIEPVGEPVAHDVVPGQALTVSVPMVGRIEAEPGAFSGPGRIIVQTVQAVSPPESFVLATKRGIDVTLEGTALVSPVKIVFDDPEALVSVSDTIPVALHKPRNGPWETMAVSLTEDGLPYLMVNGFSGYILGFIPIPEWITGALDSIADYATQRTDPRACPGGAPQWSSLRNDTTLVHLCAITNVDAASGAPRAEIQVQSNRRYFQFVSVPPDNDYLWVADQPDPLRQAIGKITGGDWRRTALLPGNGWFTAGYRQPAQTENKQFNAEITYASAAFSLVTSLLGLKTQEASSLVGIAFVTGVCIFEFAGGLSWDAAKDFLECFFSKALENLDNPDLALRSAMDFYGEQAYAKSAEQQLRKSADRIRWLGRVIRIIGIGGLIQTAFWQLPDAFSAMGNDKPGRFTLTLTGAPTTPRPTPTQPSAGQPAGPRIQLSRGGAAPQGYWYSVTLSGFAAGLRVTVACHDSVDRSFHSQTLTIGADGRATDTTLCYSADGPDHWVTGGGVESNHVQWGGGAQPPPPPPAGDGWFTLATDRGPAGSGVTGRVRDCPSGSAEVQFWFVDAAGERRGLGGMLMQDNSAPYSNVLHVPHHSVAPWGSDRDAATGPGRFEATCVSSSGSVLRTGSHPFTVTGSSLRFTVSHSSVRAGDTVRVAPLAPCVGGAFQVTVAIQDGHDDFVSRTLTPGADGSWPAVDITIPSSFKRGGHAVDVLCNGTHIYALYYGNQLIQIE